MRSKVRICTLNSISTTQSSRILTPRPLEKELTSRSSIEHQLQSNQQRSKKRINIKPSQAPETKPKADRHSQMCTNKTRIPEHSRYQEKIIYQSPTSNSKSDRRYNQLTSPHPSDSDILREICICQYSVYEWQRTWEIEIYGYCYLKIRQMGEKGDEEGQEKCENRVVDSARKEKGKQDNEKCPGNNTLPGKKCFPLFRLLDPRSNRKRI